MASEFTRDKDGFHFKFGGVNTRDVPDALAPDKYTAAQNIRSTGATAVRTRPGYVQLFTTGNNNNAVTDIRGYAGLSTDALPRFLAHDSAGNIWLDNNNTVGSLAGNTGFGASMIPFRPAQSPQSWIYIGSQGDYQKFSAPDANNNVTQYKVGIKEPQNQVEAAPNPMAFSRFATASWNNGGTAGATSSSNRSADTVGAVIVDPNVSTRFYVQVGNNTSANYSTWELVSSNNFLPIVMDVIPSVGGNGSNISIGSIRYANGNTGACVITPNQIISSISGTLGGLKRGALFSIGGNETVAVLGVIPGPGNQVAFLTSTANTHAANETLVGLPAIVVDAPGAPTGAIISTQLASNITTGIGTLTQAFTGNTNPFGANYQNFVPGIPGPNDYVHMSVSFSDPTQLIQLMIMFTLDSNNNNFTGDLFYYAVRPGDLVGLVNGNQTLIPAILQAAETQIITTLPTAGNIAAPAQSSSGNSQWAEIIFPVSALTRVGGDLSKSLANATGMQLQVNCNSNLTFNFGSIWIGGGSKPDQGNDGVPYLYRAVPLSSVTGVRGNPTPVMRYAVPAHRQPTVVKTSALVSNYDAQIDTWEVFRYGGSVTSYRFIGTAPTGTDFTDNVPDDAARAGRVLDIDNTEPWPSIDIPYRANSNITAYGPYVIITGNVNTAFPASITNWLPGTIMQVGGQDAFTLRSRPTSLGGNNGYLFEFEECIGSGNQSSVFVLEPNVARQTLPYLWGPNEQGYVFGCGDPLRPGVVSWCKGYGLDASPTKFNLELCPPSEPLMGGEVISGISLVASSLRWWALYFQAGQTPLYAQVEIAVGKRLASPWGKCTDGKALYFWATDCIAMTSGQGGAVSLTDLDLFNLFPHGGLVGKDTVRGSITYYAPDYSRAATFRLAVREGILYALYQDTNGIYRMLIGQFHSDGISWESDAYALSISAVYAIEQPKGTLELSPSLFPAVVMGSNNGSIVKLQDYTNDGATPITGYIYPFEWDGGDQRVNELWGDEYVDLLAPAGITITPVSLGIVQAPPTVIPANNNRQFVVVSLNGGVLQNYIGIQASWTDNFNTQNNHTKLYLWQPSFVDQVETTTDRAADWTNCGTPDNKFFQGIKLDADTFNSTKILQIQDADSGNLHVLQPAPIRHNGRQTLAYSFATPFLAHMVKDVPGDMVQWRKFGIEYIWEPSPEAVQSWITQWTALGGKGFQHIARIEAAFATQGASTTLSIKSYDGPSPANISLPYTNGVYQKQLLTLTLNKGQLYQFSVTSNYPFRLFLNDWIIWVGAWGRQTEYAAYRSLGGEIGGGAKI